MGIKSISSLTDFFEWHAEQKRQLQRYNDFKYIHYAPVIFDCFFRGASAWRYQLIPSIYRSTARLQNEDKIVADCLAQRPQDFRDDKNTFERLVRMQHYGVPTRLLDVTKSPLVALYFAVQNQKEEVGKLSAIFVAQRNIKYADSDTVSVVANIANMPYCWTSFASNNLFHKYLKTLNDNAEQEFLIDYNKRPMNQKLHQQILREKSYFQPRIKKDDLERIWVVLPPMNNERIRRQQGAFLLFGIAGHKKHCIDIIEREHAERLLEAIDILERLAMCVLQNETLWDAQDMMLQSVDRFAKYFKWDPNATDALGCTLGNLSPSDENFSDNVRRARSKYFQQIADDSVNKIIVAESKLGEDAPPPDWNDLVRYKFFYDFVREHRAVFQTSVEVRNKSGILQELKDFGITKSYLFPDLSSVGEEINARYPANQ